MAMQRCLGTENAFELNALVSADGKTQTTEYCFYCEQTRDAFLAAKRGVETLVHPHILRVDSCAPSREGDIFLVVVRSESSPQSLSRLTLTKRRQRLSWSVTEVSSILSSLASALLYAHSSGFHAISLSPENVVVTEEGCKLSTLERGWGWSLPTCLAPEIKSSYARMIAGDAKTDLDSIDLEKAEVFALGNLVYFLLNPASKGISASNSDLRPEISALALPEVLEKALTAMVSPVVEERPTLFDLISYIEPRHPPTVSDYFNEFVSKLDRKDFESAGEYLRILLDSGKVTAKVTSPCCLCGKEMEIGPENCEIMRMCSSHVCCSMNCLMEGWEKFGCMKDTNCPYCVKLSQSGTVRKRVLKIKGKKEETKREMTVCATCRREFSPDAADEWRLELLGSPHFAEAQRVCSQRCMPQDVKESEIAPAVGDFAEKSLTKMTRKEVSSFVSVQNVYLSLFHRLGSQESVSEEYCSSKTEAMEIIRENILVYTSSFECHLCRRELSEKLYEGRWMVCAGRPVFVCSKQCLAERLGVDIAAKDFPDLSCSSCGGRILGSDLAETFAPPSTPCANCKSPSSQLQPCGHYMCVRCLSSSCKICTGFPLLSAFRALFTIADLS